MNDRQEEQRLLRIGDVFVCPTFSKVCGYDTHFDENRNLHLNRHRLIVNNRGKQIWTKRETKPGGWTRNTEMITETTATSPDLDDAEWVVEEAQQHGGGTSTGMNGLPDSYPGGWHITARRLAPDGTYDINGETVEFYQTGSFTSRLEQTIIIKRKMQRMFQ